jgi:chemotaxis protein MotB
MAAIRRRERSTNIWPGFVDALATLLLVIIFLLLIFVLAQFFLNQALSGRDSALDQLRGQVSELADLLALERRAQKNMKTNLEQLSAELQASVAQRDDLKATLNAMRVQAEDTEAKLRQQLATSEAAGAASRERIEAQLAELSGLSHDIEALKALRTELEKKIAEMAAKAGEREEALTTSKKALLEERELSKSARAELALLNQQTSVLRQQLARIEAALQASEKLNEDQKSQIVNLGKRLNAALATKVQELSRYRSEFFGRLRELLGNQPGLRVVGDRFVFQSEVLFDTASAEIGTAGERQLDALATTLIDLSQRIPKDIDWVLRVDGHTDSVPISTTQFPSNWELSTARAIAVVRHLIDRGLPAERLVAAGFGQYRPLDNGTDEIAKRRNRRIELKLTER